jgi:hypothetical protein
MKASTSQPSALAVVVVRAFDEGAERVARRFELVGELGGEPLVCREPSPAVLSDFACLALLPLGLPLVKVGYDPSERSLRSAHRLRCADLHRGRAPVRPDLQDAALAERPISRMALAVDLNGEGVEAGHSGDVGERPKRQARPCCSPAVMRIRAPVAHGRSLPTADAGCRRSRSR